MAWHCVTNNCGVLADGAWNGKGVAYYSITSDILQLHGVFFDFITNISPAVFVTVGALFILTLMIAIWRSTRRMIVYVGG